MRMCVGIEGDAGFVDWGWLMLVGISARTVIRGGMFLWGL